MALLLNLLLCSAAIGVALPATGHTENASSHPFSQMALAPWDAGAVSQYPIHSSCNATQRRQIELGLNETIALAEHAKAHILRWRNESEIYRKYFGNRPSMEPVGAFDIVINGDKENALFRCDNPDGNCDLDGEKNYSFRYAGHWRGENGTGETVICDLSYEARRSLSTMCALGYTVSGSETNTFWASDLLHRLYHLPTFGQDWIDHFADGYKEVVDLAAKTPIRSTRDSETLQYFALEVYAFDISVPGIGCPGAQNHQHSSEEKPTTSQNQPSATGTTSEPPSKTSEVPANCHTHDGGELHCT
ncbi:hypothetical protein NUU61_005274 [Penicillium alfredii]|uniref:Putative peptidase domain-containing protein n=1 Tax=Penicillium alfredii TaxID=1506179 RepID=A0A9W9F990_9EURO|nr:uncharacterized protein NUU61_005274 [Penicillium alfredii]KAJ5095918.1 hypothetical protein NUU61_005274 [Penicillium alfredii]